VSECGEEVAGLLLGIDVVQLVLLIGVEGLCSGGSTARPSGGRALSSPALWKMLFRHGRMKLDGLGSTSGLWRCSSSTRSGLGGSGGS
jgi:hypothetical protein